MLIIPAKLAFTVKDRLTNLNLPSVDCIKIERGKDHLDRPVPTICGYDENDRLLWVMNATGVEPLVSIGLVPVSPSPQRASKPASG